MAKRSLETHRVQNTRQRAPYVPLWPNFSVGPADEPMPREQALWLKPNPPGIEDHSEEAPRLIPYLVKRSDSERQSASLPGIVLVFPGGGYMYRSEREAGNVCCWLNSLGLHAVLVHYRVQRRFPAALLDARRAVQLTRAHAETWGADPHRVGVLGFSAGGHVAAMLAAAWDFPKELGPEGAEADALADACAADARPDAAILCYPVISGARDTVGVVGEEALRSHAGRLQPGDPRPMRHYGSCAVLLGEEPLDESWPSHALQKVSAERWVRSDPKPPPCFIWHTAEDETVPAQHAMCFASSLAAVSAPYALHVFSYGPHGLALAEGEDAGAAGAWKGLCVKWLHELKWL